MRTKRCLRFPFVGGGALSTSAGANPFVLKDTSAAGSPTANYTADGLKLLLASTSEAEILTAYFGDVLRFLITDLCSIEFRGVKVGAIDSVTTLVLGVASAQNDTVDSITNNAWFKIDGSASTSALVVETDDNVTDLDDKATGLSLSSTKLSLKIDWTTEIKTVGPPGLSKGQQATFWATDANGNYRRVAAGNQFDMSGFSTGVQPFIQLQKASGTGVPWVTVHEVVVEYYDSF